MTDFILRWPGEESEWTSLAGFLRQRFPDSEALKGQVADYVSAIKIKVRVLQPAARLALIERARAIKDDDPDRAQKSAVIDRAWVESGLAGILGVQAPIGMAPSDPAMLDAFEATDLMWVLALAVRAFNELDPASRAAFFTLAQAATPGVAPTAQSPGATS